MEELTSVTGKNVNKNTDTWVDSTEEVTVGNVDFFLWIIIKVQVALQL